MISRYEGCCTRAVVEESGATSARHLMTGSPSRRSRSGAFWCWDRVSMDGPEDAASVFVGTWLPSDRSPERAGRSPRLDDLGEGGGFPQSEMIRGIERQAKACAERRRQAFATGSKKRVESHQQVDGAADRNHKGSGSGDQSKRFSPTVVYRPWSSARWLGSAPVGMADRLLAAGRTRRCTRVYLRNRTWGMAGLGQPNVVLVGSSM